MGDNRNRILAVIFCHFRVDSFDGDMTEHIRECLPQETAHPPAGAELRSRPYVPAVVKQVGYGQSVGLT